MYCTVLYCAVLFSWNMFYFCYIIVIVTASLPKVLSKDVFLFLSGGTLACGDYKCCTVHYFNLLHCSPDCPAEEPHAGPVPDLLSLASSCAGFFDTAVFSSPQPQARSSSDGIISACNVHRFKGAKSSSYWIVSPRAAGEGV